MSSAITSAPAATTSLTDCGSLLYVIPVDEPACALPYRGNNTDILDECCKDANIVAYRENCGIYCVALGQNVQQLHDCFVREGAGDAAPFCNKLSSDVTAMASTDPPAATSVVASVIDGDDDDKSSKTTGKDDDDDKPSATDSAGNAKSTDKDNAAPGVKPSGISTVGVVIGALLFSFTFGALQI